MQPEIDFAKIGQRIKRARDSKEYSQEELGALVGVSNSHISHVETGEKKVSLTLLLKISKVLEKDYDYFLMDTPYAKKESVINGEIAEKLGKCNSISLMSVNKLLDQVLETQEMYNSRMKEYGLSDID